MPFSERVVERIPKRSDATTLKPCPFCGSYPVLEAGRSIRVICKSCGCQTETVSSITLAVGKWNKRTDT